MTFRPTTKRPGIWPGASGGYEAGELASSMCRARTSSLGGVAGGRANADKHGTSQVTIVKRRAAKPFGVPNGTISGLSRSADQRITEQFKQQHAIHVRQLARGKR